jgi:death-on-curing family protein
VSRKHTTVAQLASESGIEIDDALIALWDAGFAELLNGNDLIGRGEASRARRALGLATRRELANANYWLKALDVDYAGLAALLEECNVVWPAEGGRLRKRAIHRLQTVLREQMVGLQLAERPPSEQEGSPSVPDWEVVGHEVAEIRLLTADEVRMIHAALATDFENGPDPISPPGVRSESLLGSALHRPSTSLGSTRKYPTIEMTGAALFHSLVHDHAFHNGNKRTALVSLLVFLDENGLMLRCEEDELFKLVLQLAKHALVDVPRGDLADHEVMAVAKWLKEKCRWMGKGDRAIPWRQLRRLLVDQGCEFDQPFNNKIGIRRAIRTKSRFLGRPQEKTLRVQAAYANEGREVEKGAINRIRRDLRLDDENGIDSRAFYDNEPTSAGEFIVRYRKTLRRLARL